MQHPRPIQIDTIAYDGELDEFGFRTKFGLEQWPDDVQQSYKGRFWRDSLHGRGKYVWGHEKTFYEGMFYANNLEGYGKFQYADYSTFEGLFKSNRRFGPGVFTYRDGTQDVGLWYGTDLIRLCRTVSPEWMPRFSQTPLAKVKLLKFRKLVSVCDCFKDRAMEIIKSLELNDDVMKQSELLYDVYIQNPNSYFFNKSSYDHNYFCEQHCYIDVVQSLEEVISLSSNHWSINEDEEEEEVEEIFEEDENEVCLCEEQKITLLTQIKSDLLHTEQILKEIDKEIEKAKCTIYLLDTRRYNACEEESDATFEENECLYSEEDAKEYKATCKLLNAAESAEKVLLRMKNEMINKLASETEIYKERGQEHERWLSPNKIFVSNLLAWNNEKISIDMLKHVFVHRNFERYSFCIEDLLIGSREKFGKVGAYEDICVSFLKECSNGNVELVTDILLKHDLNPDLSDAKGNSGIMFAAARDRIKIIQTLASFGANLNIFNDECFTPLNMCITRYLSVLESVHDWEKAFLKDTTLDDKSEEGVMEWRPHKSLVSLSSLLHSTSSTLSQQIENSELDALLELFGSNIDITNECILQEIRDKLLQLKSSLSEDVQQQYIASNSQVELQKYVLSTEIIIPIPPPKSKKSKKKAGKTAKKPKKGKSKNAAVLEIPEEPEPTPEEILRTKQLNAISQTIAALLQYCANPNLCQVPMPSLTLAVFTRNNNLIESLLVNGANPNVGTLDENLTPLHVAVSLPPQQENVETLRILLKHSANPNVKVDACHWHAQKVNLMANRGLICNDKGKTALHILSMRYDFKTDTNKCLIQMANVLISNRSTRIRETYLGHTPLSLAVLRGNVDLTRACLESRLVNPNQMLGEEMGMALAMYALKRYKNVLPDLQTCQEIVKILIEFKANPFVMLNEMGNLMDFIDKEREEVPASSTANKKKRKKKKEKKKKEKRKKNKKGRPVQDEIIEFIQSAAKTYIEKHIQGYAVKHLYVFVEEADYYDVISENMAKFVTPEDTVRIAQMLFHKGEIPVDEETNYETMYDLIELIVNVNCKSVNDEELPSASVDIEKMLEGFDFRRIPDKKNKLNLREPETDKHRDMYNVCFNCCRKRNRELFICPDCYLVYYCSEQCLKSYYKQRNTVHKCGSIFYEEQKTLHEKRMAQGAHWRFGEEARRFICKGMFRNDQQPDLSRKLHVKRLIKKPLIKDELCFLSTTAEPFSAREESALIIRWDNKGTTRSLMEKVSKLRLPGKDKKGEKEKTPRHKLSEADDHEDEEKHKKSKTSHLKKSKSEDEYDYKDKDNHKKGKQPQAKKSKLKDEDEDEDEDKHKKGAHLQAKKSKFEDKDEDEDKDKHIKGKHPEAKKSEDEDENKAKPKKEQHNEAKSKDGKGNGEERKHKKASDDVETDDRPKTRRDKARREDGESSDREHKKADQVKRKKKDASSEGKSDKDESEDSRAGKKALREKKGLDKGGDKDESKTIKGKGGLKRKEKPKKEKAGVESGRDKHKAFDRVEDKEKSPETLRLTDQLRRFKSESAKKEELGCPSMSAGGRIVELQQRLPSKYQHFLEEMSKLWPDLDISLLFLPYACFNNGQLYYKFLTNNTVFMETYSNI